MEVNIILEGVPEAIRRLRGVPGGARVAIQQAILFGLRKARRMAAKDAQERYNIPYGWLIKAIGRPRISVLTGFLRVTGSKASLSMFPHREIFPYGVAISELKEGPPINLLHSFAHGSGPILERETKDTPRYPLRTMFGLSAPKMIGQRTQVFPELQSQIKKEVEPELKRLVELVLSGHIVPKL